MKRTDPDIVQTAGQYYAAWLAAGAEVYARSLRAYAQESGQLAEAAATALRAPVTHRAGAVEDALVAARDSQRRQLHAMRGLSTLYGIALTRQISAAHADDAERQVTTTE